MDADLAIFAVRDISAALPDCVGESRTVQRILTPVRTIKRGIPRMCEPSDIPGCQP